MSLLREKAKTLVGWYTQPRNIVGWDKMFIPVEFAEALVDEKDDFIALQKQKLEDSDKEIKKFKKMMAFESKQVLERNKMIDDKNKEIKNLRLDFNEEYECSTRQTQTILEYQKQVKLLDGQIADANKIRNELDKVINHINFPPMLIRDLKEISERLRGVLRPQTACPTEASAPETSARTSVTHPKFAKCHDDGKSLEHRVRVKQADQGKEGNEEAQT